VKEVEKVSRFFAFPRKFVGDSVQGSPMQGRCVFELGWEGVSWDCGELKSGEMCPGRSIRRVDTVADAL
jgi:hypothetical protein